MLLHPPVRLPAALGLVLLLGCCGGPELDLIYVRSLADSGTAWTADSAPPGEAAASDSDAGSTSSDAGESAGGDVGVLADSAESAADASAPDSAAPDAALGADATTPQLTVCGAVGPPALSSLSPEELNAALATKDFLLINVASASGGQIPQTDTYIDYTDTDGLVSFIGPDLTTKVVLYCNSGGRSGVAGGNLVDLGYCQISHLAGGKNAWLAAGFELE